MLIIHLFRILRLSWRNVIANKKRNFFSIFTVVLGSQAIGAVFTVNQNVERYVESMIARSGGPNLFVSLRGAVEFSDHDISELRSLPSSRYVVSNVSSDVNAVVNEKSYSLTAARVDAKYKAARPIELISGQFFTDLDEKYPARNAVISEQALRVLGFENPVGKKLMLNFQGLSLEMTIIGVAKAVYEPEERGTVWLSRVTFSELVRSSSVAALIVGTSTYKGLDQVESNVKALLSGKFASSLEIYNPMNYFENLKKEYQTFVNAGFAIGILALIAGSVGVMNMMLMGIQLRTKEIGLYRALGFSARIVMISFLSESLIILATGGLFGALLGSGTGWVIASQIVKTEPFVSQSAFMLSFSASVGIGFIFAYIPAIRASRMDVVEALRS